VRVNGAIKKYDGEFANLEQTSELQTICSTRWLVISETIYLLATVDKSYPSPVFVARV